MLDFFFHFHAKVTQQSIIRVFVKINRMYRLEEQFDWVDAPTRFSDVRLRFNWIPSSPSSIPHPPSPTPTTSSTTSIASSSRHTRTLKRLTILVLFYWRKTRRPKSFCLENRRAFLSVCHSKGLCPSIKGHLYLFSSFRIAFETVVRSLSHSTFKFIVER